MPPPMKSKNKITILVLALSALTGGAYAQSPREQLKQTVEQVQKAPNDSALRERAIRLGSQIKPAPALPDDANRYEGRAKFAFKNAKSSADLLAAAGEFEAAAKAAPWVAGYYSDLCTIYEKAEKYAEAKRNCELYLVSLNDPALVGEVKQRIAGIEFGLEKANSPQAREAAMLEKVNGARFVYKTEMQGLGSFDTIYEIEGKAMRIKVQVYTLGAGVKLHGYITGPGLYPITTLTYANGAFTESKSDGSVTEYIIQADGREILSRTLKLPSTFPQNAPLPRHTIPRQ